jgi:hypothetical protein
MDDQTIKPPVTGGDAAHDLEQPMRTTLRSRLAEWIDGVLDAVAAAFGGSTAQPKPIPVKVRPPGRPR